VYPTEKLDCLDKVWHKACFTCEVCKLKLTMNTYKGYERKPYCKAHYPHQTATSVVDTPESMRLKKQTERQSAVAYHKSYEESKGTYTAVASDPTTERVKTQQKLMSTSYDQRGSEEAQPHQHAGGAAAAAEEEEEPAPAPVRRQPEPAAAPAPVRHEPEPEPEAEPEAEPEPAAAEPEPAHEEPAAASGGARYKALYDYDAADGDEVSFREGDFIIHAEIIDEGWMRGTVESSGASGMLPSNYVEPA